MAFPLLCHVAQGADLDTDGGGVGEPAQGVGGDGHRSGGEEGFELDESVVGNKLIDDSLQSHQNAHQLTLVIILVLELPLPRTQALAALLTGGKSPTTGDSHDHCQGVEQPAQYELEGETREGEKAAQPAEESIEKSYEGEEGHQGGGDVSHQEDRVCRSLDCRIQHVGALILT